VKATELIAQLTALVTTHGDLEVAFYDNDACNELTLSGIGDESMMDEGTGAMEECIVFTFEVEEDDEDLEEDDDEDEETAEQSAAIVDANLVGMGIPGSKDRPDAAIYDSRTLLEIARAEKDAASRVLVEDRFGDHQ
jgi:hypothetical protein